MRKIILLLFLLLFIGVSKGEVLLNGAGATFPYPLYSRWFYEFEKETGIKVNYQPVGSGAGIEQIKAGTVDFGATDSPISSSEQAKYNLIMIPTVAGGIAIVYNLPNVKGLKISQEVLVDIFLGKIKTWNNDKIRALNPDLKLPSIPIVVVRRSDGSGTTDIFTNFLSKISSEWRSKVGAGTSVNWPVGIGGKGNMGVAGYVKNTIGSIGYLEVTYAIQNNLNCALIQNKAGNFISPDIKNIKIALEKTKVPQDFYTYPVNADGKDSYPIVGYTFILIRKDLKDLEKRKALVKLISWIYEKGDKIAEELNYVPLPKNIKDLALKNLSIIR